jgi:hypothetical protein
VVEGVGRKSCGGKGYHTGRRSFEGLTEVEGEPLARELVEGDEVDLLFQADAAGA